MIALGALSDTHVPGAAPRIPSRVLEVFREQRVEAILHAGDVCERSVLEELQQVAPVLAVRGNRDLFGREVRRLPRRRIVTFGGVKIGVVHGHGGIRYLANRLAQLVGRSSGTPSDESLARGFSKDVSVIVYGHTHVPRNERVGGRLFFNPGSTVPPYHTGLGPTIGLIRIEGGVAATEILKLM
jgi:putative phosphoesterase